MFQKIRFHKILTEPVPVIAVIIHVSFVAPVIAVRAFGTGLPVNNRRATATGQEIVTIWAVNQSGKQVYSIGTVDFNVFVGNLL